MNCDLTPVPATVNFQVFTLTLNGLLGCLLSPAFSVALSGFLAPSYYTFYPHMLLNSSGDPPSHHVLPSQILRSSYLEPLDGTSSSYGFQPQLEPGSAVMGVVTVQRDGVTYKNRPRGNLSVSCPLLLFLDGASAFSYLSLLHMDQRWL